MKAAFWHYAVSDSLSRVLPRRAAYAVGRGIARWIHAASPGERRAVESNLRVVLGGAEPEVLRTKSRELYENFSRYCVDLLYPGECERVEFENEEVIGSARAKGRGAVVVTAHLGHWELTAMELARLHPVSIVANRHSDGRVNRLFMQRRVRHGVRVISGAFAFRSCIEALRANKIVGITGDREFSKSGGAETEFFGRTARLPRGAAVLSLRSGSPLVACSIRGAGESRWRARFEEPLYPDGLDEAGIHRRMAQLMEAAIRRDPTRWFVFEPFWP